MSAKKCSLMFVVLSMVWLAGCGGGSTSNNAPEVTAEPTLTFDERANFSPGSIENPLKIVVRPVHRVFTELQLILADLTEASPENITEEQLLRDDLSLPDNLNTLSAPLNTSYSVSFTANEFANLQTVADLTRAVEDKLGQQVSQTLFERTSIYFEVVPVDSYGDGLNAVCSSNQGVVSMAWLDGITSIAATQGACGDISLSVATLGGAYDVGLIEDVALAVEIEATPELEMTAEATPDEGEPTTIPTETPTPTAEPTLEPTLLADVEVTPEATAEFVGNLDDSLRIGTPVLIMFNRALGSTSIDTIRGRTFCRIGYDDFFTWLVPSLMFRRNNIDPQSDIASIVDYENEAQLVRAVADGRCTAATISEDSYESLQNVVPEEVWDDVRLGTSTPKFPYALLVYPPDVQTGVRLTLNAVFMDLATDDTAGASLRWLLGQDVIVEAENVDLSAFTAYLLSTGFDFAQLGN